MKKQSLDPKVFEEAADWIFFNNGGACYAIHKALRRQSWSRVGIYDTKYHKALDKIFKPTETDLAYWFEETPRLARSRRQLALLFLAEMVKTGSL